MARAKDADPGVARGAVEELCRQSWFPLYAFLRRRGSTADEAGDLVQGFFAELLERSGLEALDRRRGRLRTFLLGALENYLANQVRRARALKRGGGATVLSLDFEGAEERMRREPIDTETPERAFDRQWALGCLERVAERLAGEYRAAGRAALFARLAPGLGGEALDYDALAAEFGTAPGSLRVAAHRLRKRYGEILLAEVGGTLGDASELADELRSLFAALGA